MAEGYGRRSTKELPQFLSVANGSLERVAVFSFVEPRSSLPGDSGFRENRFRSESHRTNARSAKEISPSSPGERNALELFPFFTRHVTRTTKTSSEVSR